MANYIKTLCVCDIITLRGDTMKKIISLALVLILLLSFCSCKKEESGATASPDSLVENNQPETNEPEVQKPETKDPEVQEPEKQQPETQVTVEKGEFHPYTVDDYFRPYEVIVTLTQEESGKGLEYTPKDFPDFELLSISEFYEFTYTPYNYDYQGDFADNRKTIILLLKNPNKQTVLDYIEILKSDERVYLASPSVLFAKYGYSGNYYSYLAVTFDAN